MDAVEFLKERRRLCNAQDGCDTCPISIACPDYFANTRCTKENTDDMVATVEQWAKDHPVKTRQSEFLKVFPYVRTDRQGVIDICPNRVNRLETCVAFAASCFDCRRDYWNQEVTE